MAAYKPWRDKAYLHKMYVQEKKTIEQIAEDCKRMGYSVTPMTIFNNLKANNLLRKSRNLGKRSVGGSPSSRKRGGYYG